MLYVSQYNSPLGGITIVCDENSLIGIWFDGQKYFMSGISGERRFARTPISDRVIGWLDAYFAGENPPVSFPLAPEGTDFRRLVWGELMKIKYGATESYGEIAKRLAAEKGANVSARAVGTAVGHNPISIIVPCHRVIAADGGLAGYAAGIDKKAWLLKFEKNNASEIKSRSAGLNLK